MDNEELLTILLNETLRIPPPIRRQNAFSNLWNVNNYGVQYNGENLGENFGVLENEEPLYRTNYELRETEINIKEMETLYRSFSLLSNTSLERSNSEGNFIKNNMQPISLKKINTF